MKSSAQMQLAKRVVLRAANRVVGVPAVSQRILRKCLVVFIYHEVSNHPSLFNSMFGLNVSPAVFSRQLDLIREYFHVLDPVQLAGGRYETPGALVTFDDGNLSYFRDALPILKAKGIPSVVFLNMGPVGGEVCWSGLVTYLQSFERGFYEQRGDRPTGYDFCEFTEAEVYRYLDSVDRDALFERVRVFRGPIAGEADVAAVAGEPLVYLGNHLHNHYNAILLNYRLTEEYWKNQRIIDDHPRGLRWFSYPFSSYNDETTRVIRAAGAKAVFAVGGLPNVNGDCDVYYRVQLDEDVLTERDMLSRVLKNYAAERCRGVIRSFDRLRRRTF